MLLLSVLSFFIIVHCWFRYILQQFSLIYVVFESTLLNYANPWTFQRFARAAQKKGRNEQMKNLTHARTRTQFLGFSSADALPTKLRVPVGRTRILILISFQFLDSLRCLPFMWTFILDMFLLSVFSFFIIVHCWFRYIIQQFSLLYVVSESTLSNYANPCRNWTFQRFAMAAQKKGCNGTYEKSDTR